MEQRSEEWFKQRLGRFTASTVHKLMGVQGLGDTGLTLAFEKACEIVFGRDESWNVTDWNMRRGIELEPVAFELFKSLMARKFITVTETSFFPSGSDSGSSPDGLVDGKGIRDICEIKCPQPNKFFKLVAGGIKAIEKSHIDQMQKQMHDTNSANCYYFNYLEFDGIPMHHTIVVPADKSRQELIEQRIKDAVVERDKYVKALKQNIQFTI